MSLVKFLKISSDGVPVEADSTADEISIPNVTIYTADETLLATDALYISAADSVSKALADNNSITSRLMGFAKAAAADTTSVSVMSEGLLSGFSGLVAGTRYYLSPSLAGAITATVPVGNGNTIVQAGYARSANSLQIHIEQMGRRA